MISLLAAGTAAPMDGQSTVTPIRPARVPPGLPRSAGVAVRTFLAQTGPLLLLALTFTLLKTRARYRHPLVRSTI